MQHEIRSSRLTIEDPRAAAVFAQSHGRRVLMQFAQQPRSIGEVAQALQIDIKRLHHQVTRLHRLGLLLVVETKPRAGRAVHLYQAAARSFFIPSTAVPSSFSRGLALELREALTRDAAAGVSGMEFWLDEAGRVAGRTRAKPGAGWMPLDSWRILRLSAPRAAQLQQELLAVLDRFQAEPARGGQVYLVHAGMARRAAHEGATDNPAAPAPQAAGAHRRRKA